MSHQLRTRLARIEQDGGSDRPLIYLSDEPLTEEEHEASTAVLPADWREQVADCRLHLRGNVVSRIAPVMTDYEWGRRYCTED